MTDSKMWLLDNVPYDPCWHRFYLFWKSSDEMREALQSDPGWTHERSNDASNEAIR